MKDLIKKFINWWEEKIGKPLFEEVLKEGEGKGYFYDLIVLKVLSDKIKDNKSLYEVLKKENTEKYAFFYYSQDQPLYCKLIYNSNNIYKKKESLDNLVFFFKTLGKKVEWSRPHQRYNIFKEEKKCFDTGKIPILSTHKVMELIEKSKEYIIKETYFIEIGNDAVFRVKKENINSDGEVTSLIGGKCYFLYKHEDGEVYVLSFDVSRLCEIDFEDFSYFLFNQNKIIRKWRKMERR